jgi:hypothetical protein
MVNDERDTTFVRADRLRVRQRHRVRTKSYPITISAVGRFHFSGSHARAIDFRILCAKRGDGALEDLSCWNSLQWVARSNRKRLPQCVPAAARF